jgi:ATP-dependent DNA helicase RecQ
MKTKLMPSGVYLQRRGIAHVLNSSLTKTEIAQVKRHLFGLTKLLYVAPESLTKRENVNFLKM